MKKSYVKCIIALCSFLLLFVFIPFSSFATVSHTSPLEWWAMDNNTTNDLNDIWGSSANNIYAVGESGTILSNSQ